MAPRVHPCICGHVSRTYLQMKKHRRVCTPWKNRSDPRKIANNRLRKTRQEDISGGRSFRPCVICGKRQDHHAPNCPHSQGEMVRREAVAKHGIDPVVFDRLLRVLAKRYENGETVEIPSRATRGS